MHYALVDYVLDIAQNAVEAGSAEVVLELDEGPTAFRVEVRDDGKGMDAEELSRALDPFCTDGVKHARRKVGLGLPFLRQATGQAGGEFAVESEKGRGTGVSFSFPAGGLDSPPLGDLPSLLLAVLTLPGAREMVVRRRRAAGRGYGGDASCALDYELRRSELAEALGGLERASELSLLRDFLRSQEED